MEKFDALRILDFDHLEFAVADVERASELYLRMGFEKAASREIRERQLRSSLMVQNDIWIVLSQSSQKSDPVAKFVAAHGDGVISIGLRCEDAVSAFEVALNRGAEIAESPKAYEKDFGSVQQTSIKAFGDVRHTFISRTGSLFMEGFDTAMKPHNRGVGLQRIDHITNNVEKGKREHWKRFYEQIFGLQDTRFFDIHTERSGLYSTVMQSPNGVIKMPINEPTEDGSQIQEYLDINHGPGVQHVALQTGGIIESVRSIKREGVSFLSVPDTYYEDLPKRVPQIQEPLGSLQDLQILGDGSAKGYLLQIFTENVVGPFFYEVIQRKGDDGFGEGNFRALFEAMERDQIRRGTLK